MPGDAVLVEAAYGRCQRMAAAHLGGPPVENVVPPVHGLLHVAGTVLTAGALYG